VLKVELHAHTSDDPEDRVVHTVHQLVDHAASLRYGGLAITLHNRYLDPARWSDYARSRGITPIAGIERTIEGRHVLLINFPAEAAAVTSFDEIARLKAATNGLVVAPHPFYPTPSALRSRLDRHAVVFDAVEINALYTRDLDFNRRAVAWARSRGKPLVGNSDVHALDQMGTTYSLVDAPPDPDAICDAIRAGRVALRTEPLSTARAATTISRMAMNGVWGRLRRLARGE
jgi:predicted metal-dependent phosphoesterase TrpH